MVPASFPLFVKHEQCISSGISRTQTGVVAELALVRCDESVGTSVQRCHGDCRAIRDIGTAARLETQHRIPDFPKNGENGKRSHGAVKGSSSAAIRQCKSDDTNVVIR